MRYYLMILENMKNFIDEIKRTSSINQEIQSMD